MTIPALDTKKDETGSISKDSVKHDLDDKGLPDTLTVGIGARVMVTRNEDVDDKIVNGLIGTVTAITKDKNGKVTIIWIEPDNKEAGQMKTRLLSKKLKTKHPNSVPITRKEDYITIAKNSTMKRKQFPLSLAWAATIHKYQGQSVDVLAIGGYEGKF